VTFLKLCLFTNAIIGKAAFVNQSVLIYKCGLTNNRIFTLNIWNAPQFKQFLFTAFPFHCCCFVPVRVCIVPTFPFAFFSYTFGKVLSLLIFTVATPIRFRFRFRFLHCYIDIAPIHSCLFFSPS